MRVDHGGAQIFVPEQLLDRADSVTVLKKVVAKQCRNVRLLTGFPNWQRNAAG